VFDEKLDDLLAMLRVLVRAVHGSARFINFARLLLVLPHEFVQFRLE
jgi:hypothetical protein